MNTYDFDQTIYEPDSSYSFYLFCLKKYPGAVLRTVPKTLAFSAGYALKRIKTKKLKEQLFSFLRYLPDVDAAVCEFWDEHRSGIGKWYLDQKKDDDIIISASPEFLLQPIAEELGVRLIATPMDKRNGMINGENCHDFEKVRRFNLEYPGAHTEKFYSDSLSDTPMAEIADEAYLVCKGKFSSWPLNKTKFDENV